MSVEQAKRDLMDAAAAFAEAEASLDAAYGKDGRQRRWIGYNDAAAKFRQTRDAYIAVLLSPEGK